MQEAPVAISAFSRRNAGSAPDHADAGSGKDYAQPAVQAGRPAFGQQRLVGRLHPRHRPARSHGGSRPGRRHLYRRGLRRPLGRRDDRIRRHRQRRSPARAAGHAVRPQHDRRRDPRPHQGTGFRRPVGQRAACASATINSSKATPHSTCRSPTRLRCAFRAAARKRDGYVIRAYDGLRPRQREHRRPLNAALRWEPSATFKLSLRGDYTKRKGNGAPFVFAGINEDAPVPAIVSVAAGCPGATMPFPGTPQSRDRRTCRTSTIRAAPTITTTRGLT